MTEEGTCFSNCELPGDAFSEFLKTWHPCFSALFSLQGVPEKKQLPVTVPKSPAFALKNKVGTLAREQEKEKVRLSCLDIISVLSTKLIKNVLRYSRQNKNLQRNWLCWQNQSCCWIFG